jgi:hypothetical protein
VDAPTPKRFRLLSHEEFAKLSIEEKVAYLSKAIEAVRHKVPIIGANATPPDSADDKDTGLPYSI